LRTSTAISVEYPSHSGSDRSKKRPFEEDDKEEGNEQETKRYKAAIADFVTKCTDPAFVTKLVEAYPKLAMYTADLEQCAVIWRLVEANKTWGIDALSDGTVRNIPFVSMTKPAALSQRFTFTENNTCVDTLCRKKLDDLVAVAEVKDRVFVWGTSGGGKSHLMNTFAFYKFLQHHLAPDKPRILWLPDLNEFARNPTLVLFHALLLACFDSPSLLAQLCCISTNFEQLQAFAFQCQLDLIADNHNVLHKNSKKGSATITQREHAEKFLGAFPTAGAHRLYYCASANQRSVILAAGVQDSGITKFPVLGGWSPVELQTFFEHKHKNIAAAEKAYKDARAVPLDAAVVEGLKRRVVVWESVFEDGKDDGKGTLLEEGLLQATGGISLDVSKLLHTFNEELGQPIADFANCLAQWKARKAETIKADLKKFFALLLQNGEVSARMEDAWKYLLAGALGSGCGEADYALVQCSYFYPSVDERGDFDWTELHAASDVVKMAALEVWLEHQFDEKPEGWNVHLEALLPARFNPSLKGFVDEMIVLTILSHVKIEIKATRSEKELHIAVDVGTTVPFSGQWKKPDRGRRPATVVTTLATIVDRAFKNSKCVQCKPLLWNYAQVDEVLLCPDPKAIVGIQVTYETPKNAKKAAKTAKFFGTNHWQRFAVGTDDAEWAKVLLWISASAQLPALDGDIYQAHLSFEEVFKAGNIQYS
jgi:hypothetical protein